MAGKTSVLWFVTVALVTVMVGCAPLSDRVGVNQKWNNELEATELQTQRDIEVARIQTDGLVQVAVEQRKGIEAQASYTHKNVKSVVGFLTTFVILWLTFLVVKAGFYSGAITINLVGRNPAGKPIVLRRELNLLREAGAMVIYDGNLAMVKNPVTEKWDEFELAGEADYEEE